MIFWLLVTPWPCRRVAVFSGPCWWGRCNRCRCPPRCHWNPAGRGCHHLEKNSQKQHFFRGIPWNSWLFGKMIQDDSRWWICRWETSSQCGFGWDLLETSSNHLVVITGFYEIQTGSQRNNHGMKATDASERQLWFKNMASNVQCPPIQCCFLPWLLRSIFGPFLVMGRWDQCRPMSDAYPSMFHGFDMFWSHLWWWHRISIKLSSCDSTRMLYRKAPKS